MFSEFLSSPFRFLIAAGVLAALLCLFPVNVDAPQESGSVMADGAKEETEEKKEMTIAQLPQATKIPLLPGLPAGADLSERTTGGCFLHKMIVYAPCGHSVQRRENLPAQLCGLSRTMLEAEIGGVIPGAVITGFSGTEVDVTLSLDLPCPLHWVLRGGEDGLLHVMQNIDGEALETVRSTDIRLAHAPKEEQDALLCGRVFDDVQALEGYLESLSS